MSKFIVLLMAVISSATAGEFFPLQTGNIWTYRAAATGETLVIKVGLPVFMNRQIYYSLRGYTPQPLLVRLDEHNNLVQVDPETYVEQPLTQFNSAANVWWEAPSRGCDQQGRTAEQRGKHGGPAGPFQDVLEISYRTFACADFGAQSEQYAENIGMVRRVISTIAGPRPFDLIYARLGKLVIDAQPHGDFSISLQAGPAPDTLAATLRLQTNPPDSISLAFATAQEFDVALVDPAGREVWKWSDGQVFAQASHSSSISGLTIPVSIPRPSEPGSYVIRAWLTTADPSFAASVPFTVPAADGGPK